LTVSCATNTFASPGAKSTAIAFFEVLEERFPELERRNSTYVDDEYAEREIRHSKAYCEYAKDICKNYLIGLRRYKLFRECKQYIDVSDREEYQTMYKNLVFASNLSKRCSKITPISWGSSGHRQGSGRYASEPWAIERRQTDLYQAFVRLQRQRDKVDGVWTLIRKSAGKQEITIE